MVNITVKKIGGPSAPKGPGLLHRPRRTTDTYTIDSDKLGKVWCSFFLKSAFCRIQQYLTRENDTAKLYAGRYIYVVEANNRRMVYNANYDIGNPEFIYVKEFVNYVLKEHKYKKNCF